MAQQASFTVFDGASTPVAHNFVEDGVSRLNQSITAAYKETLAGVTENALPRYYEKLTRLPKGVMQAEAWFEVPVMESINGQNSSGYTAPPEVAFRDRAKITVWGHGRSTETSRRLCLQMLINKLINSSVTAAPVVTGSLPFLTQKLIIAS